MIWTKKIRESKETALKVTELSIRQIQRLLKMNELEVDIVKLTAKKQLEELVKSGKTPWTIPLMSFYKVKYK